MPTYVHVHATYVHIHALAHMYDKAYQGLYFWYTGAAPHQHYLVDLLTEYKSQTPIAQRS